MSCKQCPHSLCSLGVLCKTLFYLFHWFSLLFFWFDHFPLHCSKSCYKSCFFLKVALRFAEKWTLLGRGCKLLYSSHLGISRFTFWTMAGEDVTEDPVDRFCPLDPVVSSCTGLSLFEHFEVFGGCHTTECHVELTMTESQCFVFPMTRGWGFALFGYFLGHFIQSPACFGHFP